MIWLERILGLLLVILTAATLVTGQASKPELPRSAAVELGSRTAKGGFTNETEIRDKFNNWKTDADAPGWLAAMGYKIDEIESVVASKPHGEKADVEVRIRVLPQSRKDAKQNVERREGISIKLVSSRQGFNQIDKRWLATYARMWKMPPDVVRGLRLFVGEVKPEKLSRNTERMFLNELDAPTQKSIVEFFTTNKVQIVSDIFEGDGPFAAKWFLVALKSEAKPRWFLGTSSGAAKFFSDGPVTITRNGNLKIGRITMQRKGGDGGRETAKMLQFKINPALLLDAK